MNVNKVILVGRLTRDPELRNTSSGQNVATIGLATNRVWKDKNGQKQEQTEFHNIVTWGRLAEISAQYLTKGQEAYFEGRLQTRSYTGKDGVERKTTEVVAESMQLGSRAGGAARSPQQSQPTSRPAQKPMPAKEEEIPTINLDDEQEEVKIEDVPF